MEAKTGVRGRRVFYAYGCHGCHGDSGQGRWDLRQEMTRHGTDAELIA